MSDQTPPPPPPAAPGPPVGGEAPLSPNDERTFAMLAHLGGIVLGFIAPLIAMLVWGKRSEFVDDQSKEALNFQITLIIGYVISAVLTLVVIGAFLWFAVAIVGLVFSIIGGLAANRGERYRYPFAIRLVK